MVQPEHCQGSISTSGSSEWQGTGRTVSQLFDTQSAHLLASTLPKTAVGQVFLCGFVSHTNLGITFLTPNAPCFPA